MRLNKYLAQYSPLSRRSADQAIDQGRVSVNGHTAGLGLNVSAADKVMLDDKKINPEAIDQTIMMNKPPGYVCSRNGQGSKTVYDLLPGELHNLNPVGRLDKDTSGLLLLTNDGQLANQLAHPRYQKSKVYEVKINRPLSDKDLNRLKNGLKLEDGISKFEKIEQLSEKDFKISMAEGRNRQIRRTFRAIGYNVQHLHRIEFGPYKLNSLESAAFQAIL